MIKMKPETIMRRKLERAEARRERREELRRRLAEQVQQHGPDSIWAELLELTEWPA